MLLETISLGLSTICLPPSKLSYSFEPHLESTTFPGAELNLTLSLFTYVYIGPRPGVTSFLFKCGMYSVSISDQLGWMFLSLRVGK